MMVEIPRYFQPLQHQFLLGSHYGLVATFLLQLKKLTQSFHYSKIQFYVGRWVCMGIRMVCHAMEYDVA
jgi:hypothetical protein